MQVCYLPTNQCKDRLSFSLLERTACTNSSDCSQHEVSPTFSTVKKTVGNNLKYKLPVFDSRSKLLLLLYLYSGFVMAGVLLG